jgi:hypothetical protein
MQTSYYGPFTTSADIAMIERFEADQAAKIEYGAADLRDVCGYFGLAEWRIHKMLVGVDVNDEIDVSAAIYAGIHEIAPSLDDCAQYFINAVYVPAH